MTETGHDRVRIGVIGLGRLWEARHKPALLRLRDKFQIVAVYDQVARRAAAEASSLRCAAEDSLAKLIHRPDIEAIYLLTPQWFGLHPIRLACEARKSIYSALPPVCHPDSLERLTPMIRDSGIVFMPELARRFYPATLRLKELLSTHLGQPRVILGHTRLFGFDRYSTPGPSTQLSPVPLAIDPGSYLLDWCRHVFGEIPGQVQKVESMIGEENNPDFVGTTLQFPGGGLAQLSIGRYHRCRWGEATRFLPQPGFQVFAERGAAWVEMPDRISWSDANGTHDERLPMEPTVGDVLNEHFFRRLRGQSSLAPTLDDSLTVIHMYQKISP